MQTMPLSERAPEDLGLFLCDQTYSMTWTVSRSSAIGTMEFVLIQICTHFRGHIIIVTVFSRGGEGITLKPLATNLGSYYKMSFHYKCDMIHHWVSSLLCPSPPNGMNIIQLQCNNAVIEENLFLLPS